MELRYPIHVMIQVDIQDRSYKYFLTLTFSPREYFGAVLIDPFEGMTIAHPGKKYPLA